MAIIESEVFSNSFKESLKYFGEKIENINIEKIKDLRVSDFIKDKDIENPAEVLNNLFSLSDQYLKISGNESFNNLKDNFKYLIKSIKNYVELELISDELTQSSILNVNKLREVYCDSIAKDILINSSKNIIRRKNIKI